MAYFQYHITYLRQGGVCAKDPITEIAQGSDRAEADHKLLRYLRLEKVNQDFLIMIPLARGRASYDFDGMTLTVNESESAPQSVRPTG